MLREHRLQRRVQFVETDMAGIVHFTSFFLYMEEAEHALWREAGLSVASPADTIRFPRVSASCDYRAPLRFEDEFEVLIRVDAIGSRSIRYVCAITCGPTRIANGSMTVACIDVAETTPYAIDIPARIVASLTAQAVNRIDTHRAPGGRRAGND